MEKDIRTRIVEIVLPLVQEKIKEGYQFEGSLEHLENILGRYYHPEYFDEDIEERISENKEKSKA